MKQKTKKKKFEQVAKAPTESPGSYYVRKGRGKRPWTRFISRLK